jgi:Uma2 family endonuclease
MTAVEPDVVHVTFDHELEDYMDSRGLHYEVIDGTIVVNAAASFAHEDVASTLLVILANAAPAELVVLGSHFGFYYEQGCFLLADITVARRADCSPDGIHVAPQLVVEVLSPSTRWKDLGRKREIYEQAGVPSYWVVDPIAQTLTVLSLQDGSYVESDRLTGQGQLSVDRPYPLTLMPFVRSTP